jgi:tetratricopeptide (TPR) repeat protein
MKHVLIIIGMFFSGMALAQTKYDGAMTKGLEQLKAAKSVDDMLSASAFFERVGDAEKDKWLPYYYAAYANYVTAWMNPKLDKDKVAEKSNDLLTKAEAIEPNNSELFCMRQMTATLQMVVDPMSRWQSYGAQANSAIEKAIKADPNNPRIYYLKGQSLMNTPEAFGGGKVVAKKLFEKSVELYKNFQPASPYHPVWGKEEAEKLLAACQ